MRSTASRLHRILRGRRGGAATPAVLLTVLALAASACGDATEEAEASPKPPRRGPQVDVVVPVDEPVVIGISATLTGPDSSTGIEDRDAAIAALERWKAEHGPQLLGHDIAVVAEDDGCTQADIAAEAARRLVARPGLVGVVGPNCSGGAVAALPIYADAGVPAVSGSATRTDLTTGALPGGFFFRTSYRNDLEGTLIGLFVAFDLGADRAYLVDDDEPYGEDLARSAQRVLERNGVEVIRAGVPRGTADFGALVSEIVAADPPVVAFLGFNPEAALLYGQLRDAGYDGFFGAGDAAATPEFVSAVGEAAEGVTFAGCQLEPGDDFVSTFVDLHGYRPGTSPFTAQVADAMTVLLDATVQVAERRPDGSLVIDPSRLRVAIRSSDVDGVSGSFAFDARGDRVPANRASLPKVVDGALATRDLSVFSDLGVVPCQVQDGRLVNLLGPGAGTYRTDGS